MNLSQIIDELRAEKRGAGAQDPHQCKPRATKVCKHCNCALSVVCEPSTIVHIRNWANNVVDIKTLYHGKFYCQWCHRSQVGE